jgi:hypothetical protein
MVDFTVASQIKPPQQMSLADVMNIARGAQAYQQAQQMNPLLVQEQQANTALAQGTLQPRITQAQQQAEQGQIKTQSDQFKLSGDKYQAGLNVLGSYATDPRLTSDNKDEVFGTLDQIRQDLINRGLSPSEAMMHIAPLATYARSSFDPNGANNGNLSKILETTVKQSASPESRLALQTPELVNTGGGTYLYKKTGQIVQPGGIPAANIPSPSVVPEGTPDYSKPEALQYPIRRAGDPMINQKPSEPEDRLAGNAYRQTLQNNQGNYATTLRNLQETAGSLANFNKDALTNIGYVGAIKQALVTNFGDPRYQELAKNLANLNSNLEQSLGLPKTNAGLDAQIEASGQGKNIDPHVIGNIVDRTWANVTNSNLQTQAAQKFAGQYGDANLQTSFRPMWNKNADSKVFQAINIMNNVSDPTERKKQMDELMGTDPKARKVFAEKYANIRSLVDTGRLPLQQ